MKFLNEKEIEKLSNNITKSIVHVTLDMSKADYSIIGEHTLVSLLQPGIHKMISDALND